MTVKEAFDIANKYIKNRKIIGYMKSTDGIVFVTSRLDTDAPIIGTYHYLVKSDGEICPTNPMICKMDFKTYKEI